MRFFKGATAVLLVAMLTGWGVFHYRSAETRTRRHFGMGLFAPLDSTAIGQAVLRVLPVGTPEPAVREYLANAGIGADGMSAYYPPGADGEAVVRIEYDPASPALVKRHFGILLFFDGESRLERVEVRDWLTGL